MLYLLSPFWFKYLPLKKEPYHYLRFEKESRYYELRLDQDLLEDWTLITSNGRIKSKLGQSRTQAFSTYNEALIQLYSAIDQRYKRNYLIKRFFVEDQIYTLLLLNQTLHQSSNRNPEIQSKKSSPDKTNMIRIDRKVANSNQFCFAF